MVRSRDIIPRSLFQYPQATSSFFPNLWEDMGDKVSEWMGKDTGVTISEGDNDITIEAQLPGLANKDIDVSLHQNTLIIQGEKKEEEKDKKRRFHRRARSSYYYEVELPSSIQENTEQAHYENGILTITFQKATQSNVKKIAIKNGSQTAKGMTTEQQQPTAKQKK